MGRRATDHGDNAEWLPAAQFYDHHLGSSQPVVLHGGEIEAQPLQVHIHKGMDVGTVLSGAMDLIQGDFHQRFTTGDVWLTAMWEPHAWEVPRPNLCNVTFTFLPGVLESAVEEDLRLLAPSLEDLSDEQAALACEHVIRNHDPCISCSVHCRRHTR